MNEPNPKSITATPLLITNFPLEIINLILSKLDTKSLYNVLVTNKQLSKVAVIWLWNNISLINQSFLPYLLTFIDYYNLYYKFIFDNNDHNNITHDNEQPSVIHINDNQWYKQKLKQFYIEYKKFLSQNDLNRLTKYYLEKDKPFTPYYPYLNYIKNIYIENDIDNDNSNVEKSNKNLELMKSLNALSNYLKYCNSIPNLNNNNPSSDSPFFGMVKSLFNKRPLNWFFSNTSENNEYISIPSPMTNIQKLLIENVYITKEDKILFKDSLFKFSNNLKYIDFFYCELNYDDLLYLPVFCPNIKTVLLEHVNYDEYILLYHFYLFKNLNHFGFSLNRPFSPFTLFLLNNNTNKTCLSNIKSLRLNSDKDLLLTRYNDEDFTSSSDLQENYVTYLKERKNLLIASTTENINENNNNDLNGNDNNDNNNNNDDNNNDDNNINENNNRNNINEVNNDEMNINNDNNNKNNNEILNEHIDPDENLSYNLTKYYQQFKSIVKYIEKRNNNSLDYNEIKYLSIDLDKFLNLIYNPGYCTWKYIAKSCHNLTNLTLSFSVRLTVLKTFFLNNPNLESVTIQDIKLKSRSTPEQPLTKWDKKIQKKEEDNNFETFPVLPHLKSFILHSSYTYRLWFNVTQLNTWLKKLPSLQKLKLYIIEPIPKYFYNIHNIFKDCYTIENLTVSGPWFNEKCLNTLVSNVVRNPSKHHLKSLTISLSDDVEPKMVKELICKTSMEKLELNVHSNFDIKELYSSNADYDISSLRRNKSTYYLLSDDLKLIKSLS